MTPAWQAEFDELMKRLLDKQLPAADAARLDQILAAHDEAVDAYLRLMTLDTVVRQCAKSDFLSAAEGAGASESDADAYVCQGADDDGSESQDRLAGPQIATPAVLIPDPKPAVQSPVLGFLGGVVDYASHSSKFRYWLICAGLVAIFSIHFGALLIERIWNQNSQVASVGGNGGAMQDGHAGADEQPALVPGKMVARLTKAIDCNWRFGPRAQDKSTDGGAKSLTLALDTEFAAGQHLDLSTGLAELTFASGAQVILHAPATFTITDPLGGDLQLGKLVAKVAHNANGHGAAGFTINTPAGKVVDLGTEFGVKVNSDRTTHVIVYVGQVKVESESGVATNSSSPAQPPVTVKAGEAIVIGPGQPAKHVAPQDERFVRDLEPLVNKGANEAAYVEFMKQLKPVVWYRMEGKETERVLHDEMGGQDAKLDWDGPGNPFQKGVEGKGLWLRGGPVKDGGAIVADYPKAEHNKLSVSLWAYADEVPSGKASSMVCNWDGGKAKSGQFYLGLVQRWPRAVLNVQLLPREGKSLWIEESFDRPFPVRQWQHVAFVCDGKSVRLYRQGRPVPWDTGPLAGLRFPVDEKALQIGATADASGKGATNRWSGKLDEIAVFNDALSPETIRKLAAFGP